MSNPAPPAQTDALTDDDRELFERLADEYEDDDEMSRLCELVLQSSDTPSEEANS
ncbi:hypothetical protein SAMN04487947_1186 [Halogeometricum rufum]|uniref:Uncharacterized protein n=1 Tax=Halogeometricum rufum TaxID=553469 RepID=A0A1I6GI10_9EURY|nr:kinesin [Halogeometricum rufum]SFR41814.1 hypothetical protein SAMN04487947_1186 [Halogeometricum rufum]